MASRKEQREQARREREEREAAERAKSQRNRRLMMLGGVLAAAAVVVIVAIVISSSGDDSKTNATGGVEGAKESAQLLEGIPQKGIVLGNPEAKVTLTEFADLQCPFCKEYTLKTFPTIVAKYVRSGKVKMVFRNYAFISEDSLTAARSAESSGLQNKLWNFIDVFYNNQGEERSGYVTDEFVTKIGKAAGVDTDKMLKDRTDPKVDQAIAEAQQEAQKAGVNSTPTFLIQSGNGPAKKVQASAFDPAEFSKAIDDELANSGT